MLSIHKTYFYIFCFCVLSLFLAPALLPFSDELCLAAFAALAGLDMLYNRNLRRYRLMFVLLGVMLFYLAYSLAASPYNIPKAQINDFILQCKPLVAFSLSYAIAPKFTAGEKYFLKKLCIVLAIISVITIATGTYKILLAHIYYQGLLCFGCAVVYLLMSYDRRYERHISPNDLFWGIAILLMGLACSRSKYYGTCVLSLYLIFLYKPGTINLKSLKNIATAIVITGAVLMVAWQKINYYFISGSLSATGNFDPDMLEQVARPMLFAGSLLIFADHLILGSGLASFATFSSSTAINYSSLYHEYGISMVWGLSPEKDTFIADTFYPELAQFGLLGVFFFLTFCWWIWRKFRIALRAESRLLFAVGVMCFALLAIDGVAGCSILQIGGELLMACMGIIAGTTKTIPKTEAKALLARPITELYENKKLKEYGYEFRQNRLLTHHP